MTTKKRPIFTPEQKAQAVRIVEQSGKSIAQVAREMGLGESTLNRWVNQAHQAQKTEPQASLTAQEHQELVQLRREVKRLQMERDFLKKAAAFFAKESPIS